MPDTSKVRVRFAPSPTGQMHVGNFRTALYDYLFAKKNNGTFILRIEDTDQNRYVEGSLESCVNLLDTMGLVHDEGVFTNHELQTAYSDNTKINHAEAKASVNYPATVEVGTHGPYIQSERLDLYKRYASQLIEIGVAYHCFCTPERLEKMRQEQSFRKQAPMYDRLCLELSPEEIRKKLSAGTHFVIRQKIDTAGTTEYVDLIRGSVEIKNELLDDQILMKSDGYPTYNFANVVDDHLMNITHVLRGEEYISSTPKYIQLYKNFGWEAPYFAHLPLLLNPDKSKLSKRQGDVAVEDFLKAGYLEEALINFVALLGWHPGQGNTQEIFSLEELIEHFELSQVHKAGAVFDLKKLDWMNSEYIKKLSIDELYERIESGDFLEKNMIRKAPQEMQTEEYLKRVLVIERERLAKLSDIGEQNPFFFIGVPSYEASLLHWKGNPPEMTKEALESAREVLFKVSAADWKSKESIEKVLMDAAGERRGDFLWPLRVALTGAKRSPSPFEVAWVIGKEGSLGRLEMAIQKLS